MVTDFLESKQGRYDLNLRERKMFFRVEATTNTVCSSVFGVHRNAMKCLVNGKENDGDIETDVAQQLGTPFVLSIHGGISHAHSFGSIS